MMLQLDQQNPYYQERQPTEIRVPFVQQETGLGDALKRFFQTFGVQPCTPCQQRQQMLNQRVRLMPW